MEHRIDKHNSDQGLLDLIRLATEAEAFERSADGEFGSREVSPIGRKSTSRTPATSGRRASTFIGRARWVVTGGAGLAIAALIALAVVPRFAPTPNSGGGGSGGRLATNQLGSNSVLNGTGEIGSIARLSPPRSIYGDTGEGRHGSGEESIGTAQLTETLLTTNNQGPLIAPQHCVVLAIYQDSSGQIGCMQWQQHTLPHGRSLADLRPGELLGLSSGTTCPARPERLLVAGICGSAEVLSLTDDAAEHLAQCLVGTPDNCPSDLGSYDSRTLSCLPNGLTAIVESIAMTGR